MNGLEMTALINAGATDLLRNKLKRLAIGERMKKLQLAIPYVRQNEATLKFFGENFKQELGALMLSNSDVTRATSLFKANSSIEKDNRRKHNVSK